MELQNTVTEYLRGTSLTRDDFDFEKNNREATYEVAREDTLKETAKNLLKYGMSVEDIALNTNLSIQEINKLK